MAEAGQVVRAGVEELPPEIVGQCEQIAARLQLAGGTTRIVLEYDHGHLRWADLIDFRVSAKSLAERFNG